MKRRPEEVDEFAETEVLGSGLHKTLRKNGDEQTAALYDEYVRETEDGEKPPAKKQRKS